MECTHAIPVWDVLCAGNVCFTAQVDSHGSNSGSNCVDGGFVALMVVREPEEMGERGILMHGMCVRVCGR